MSKCQVGNVRDVVPCEAANHLRHRVVSRNSSVRKSEFGMPFSPLWAGTLVLDYILSFIHAGATMPCTLRFYRIPVHLHVYIGRRSNVFHWGYGRNGIEKKVLWTVRTMNRVATVSRIILLVLRPGTSLIFCWFYRVYTMKNISICVSLFFLYLLAHLSVALRDLLLISKFLFLQKNARHMKASTIFPFDTAVVIWIV